MTPDPLTGSYLAVYWVLDGKHDEWNRWAVEQVTGCTPTGRMFESAHAHPHAAVREALEHRATDDGCTIELALDHNYPGLVVVAGDVKDGHTHDEVDAWFRETYLPDACSADLGPRPRARRHDVAAARRPSRRRAPARRRTNRFLQLHFLDHDPEEGWADGYAKIGAGDRGQRARHPRRGRARSSRPTSAPTSTPTSSGRQL